jgi:hypothetical protein
LYPFHQDVLKIDFKLLYENITILQKRLILLFYLYLVPITWILFLVVVVVVIVVLGLLLLGELFVF